MTLKEISIATAAIALTGALTYDSIRLAQNTHRKFCAGYGWLKNQPESVQREYAMRAAENSWFFPSGYPLYVKGFLDDLRNCR